MQKNLAPIEVSPSNSNSTLIQLYHKSQKINKITNIRYNPLSKPSHFLELAIFKQHRSDAFPRAHSYQLYSSKVLFYRTFFFAMSLLFLTLGTLIFFQSITMNSHFFGDLKYYIKNFVCIFTGSLALVAAAVGYSLCVTKEATYNLMNSAKRKLAHIYARKRIEYGVKNFVFYLYYDDKALLLKIAYRELLQKMGEIKVQTIDLLSDIKKSGFDREYQERLFCQALAEMDQQLKQHLMRFKEQ